MTVSEPDQPCVTCRGRRAVLSGGVLALGAVGLGACSGAPSAPPAPSAPSARSSAGAPSASTPSGAVAPAPQALAPVGAVPVGSSLVVSTADGPVALTQPQAGRVVAHSAICTHRGCTVVPAGGTLSCPCHSSVFDGVTGAVQEGPARRPLPPVGVTVANGSVLRA